MDVREIGIYLRRQARINGMTIEAASAAAGVGKNYLWRLEVGRVKRPSVQKLKALTDAVKGEWDEVGRLLDQDGDESARVRKELGAVIDRLPDAQVKPALAAIQELCGE